MLGPPLARPLPILLAQGEPYVLLGLVIRFELVVVGVVFGSLVPLYPQRLITAAAVLAWMVLSGAKARLSVGVVLVQVGDLADAVTARLIGPGGPADADALEDFP
jgi:hypothetical protein